MRRSTLVYVLLFAVAIGAYYWFQNRPEPVDSEAASATAPAIEYLFTPADGLPNSIRIESKDGGVVEVVRDAENAWVLTQPEEAAADQGSVEAAATQVSTMRILERVPNLALDAVGLDAPEYVITLKFTSGVERIVKIGVPTPTDSGYYALGEDDTVLILSKSAVDPLLELLTNPPYAPTEVPPTAISP